MNQPRPIVCLLLAAGVPYAGSYTATKVAVVAMSESWAAELSKHNIHVSVLCPAFVQTRIHLSGRNRQDSYADPKAFTEPRDPAKKNNNPAKELVENGIAVEIVGARVIEALNDGELYIFTHPAQRSLCAERAKRIDQAFERAQSSPLLQDIDDNSPLSFM